MRHLPRPHSLQNRLLALTLGLAVAAWLIAAVLTWLGARRELDELLDGQLTQAATLLMVQAEDTDDEITETPILHKYVSEVAYQVFVGGRIAMRSSNVGIAPLTARLNGFSEYQDDNGRVWRVFSIHRPRNNVEVMVGEMQNSRQAILWAITRTMLAPLLLGLPLLAAAVWWSVRRGLLPLRYLRGALEERPPQALEPLALSYLPPELQPMVQALNALLGRVAQMVDSERRFTADAAHELRTPIAAIRAQAQVALGATDNSAERKHALHQTVAGCDRAARLVEQLLTLARLDAVPDGGHALTDLGAAVRRVVDRMDGGLAGQVGQRVEMHIAEPCLVAADDVLLGVLVRNLLDNALRYSPDGTTVRVDVRAGEGGEGPQLSVQDSGPGMSDEAIGHLGERFFRVLGSNQPGSGLGWSIVRRLLSVFGARAALGRSPELGGLSVNVRWPAPAAT